MLDRLLLILTIIAALGCGLVAGVFFAFSAFIMKALARLSAPHGAAAMRSINIVVLNPWFLGVFFGAAAACVAVSILAMLRWVWPASVLLLIGAACYVIGTFMVTIAFNVPRNQALAAADPGQFADDASDNLWRRYLVEWTAWNHVRAIAALAAAAFLTIALVLRG